MIHLYTIEAFGLEPAPWKVPDIGVDRRGGKAHRFARRSGKSNFGAGRVCMEDWQAFVSGAARGAVGNRAMETGSVFCHFEFFGETPPGRRHGELWDVGLEFNKKANKFKKKSRFGKAEADLTNLIKSTEDALKGIVYVDDCVSRPISAVPLFGPVPGVRITVRRIEPTDYPGSGPIIE